MNTPNWQKEAYLADLKLELDTICHEIALYKQQPSIDDKILANMQENLLTTYNFAVKCGLTYSLEEIT